MVFFHELGHFATAKWAGVRVNEFAIGMGPKLISKTFGETAYSLRLFPIGGFVSMEGEDEESASEGSFMSVPAWKRIIITAAGAFMNLLLGFIVVVILTSGESLIGTTQIVGFAENASSAQYLEIGDEIKSINGESIDCDNDIVYSLIRDNDGVVSMDVLRGGEKLHFDEVKFGMRQAEDGTSYIAIDFTILGVEPTFGGVVSYSFKWTYALIKLVWNSLGDIIKGNFALNQLSGPVGVTEAISEAASTNISGLLLILALITVNLGVFNLLPLPALDGGRIFFMVLEIIRGKPINQKVESTIHTVGMALLILLSIIVTFNDISKLITGG